MLLMNNPTYQGFYNPWEGQGSTIETGGGYSTPDDAPGGIWDWWNRNGDEAGDMLNTILCAIKPERCQGSTGSPPTVVQQDNTVLYVLLGVIVLLLIVFMFKK